MFQIKDFTSIAASMINYAKSTQTKVTDFTVGSVMRTLIECGAIEIDELYQKMWLGIKEGIPVAIYQAFGFLRIPALAAQGTVSFTVSAGTAYTLPAGSRFTTASIGIVFESVTDTAIGSGAGAVAVAVIAASPGISQHITNGTAFTANAARMVSAVASGDFSLGTDSETDEQRKQRFSEYVLNLARSTNSAMEYGAKTAALYDSGGNITEQVKHALAVDTVVADVVQADCYIHNGVSGASAELIAECDKVLRGYTDTLGNKVIGWKAAGVKLTVASTTNISVAITGVVTTASGIDHTATIALVEKAITDYLQSLNIGDDVIVSEIIAAAMGVYGVTDFTVSVPSANVAVGIYEKAVQGVYALT